jgi:AraC-like DNA-binding protein
LHIVTRDDGEQSSTLTYDDERLVPLQDRDRIEFLFQIEGSTRLVREGHADVVVPAATGLVAFHPADHAPRWRDERVRQRWVSVLCDTELLQRLLPDAAPTRPSFADRFASGETIVIRYDSSTWSAAERLIGYECDRYSPALLIEAKAIELLCAGIKMLLQPRSRQRSGSVALSERDVEALKAARQHIINHLAEAPTIQQIARTIGLNQQKLKVGFRELFGETIYGFTLAQRMDLAWRLLDRDRQPVKIVAARVGYRCAASFARAFERHWGTLPSALRRNCNLEHTA